MDVDDLHKKDAYTKREEREDAYLGLVVVFGLVMLTLAVILAMHGS